MSQLLDPNDFIITRKRKKYRFALFHNSPLCFEFDECDKAWPVDVVEIGAGTGQFIAELAACHPEQNFVAIDVKGDRLQKGARQAEAQGLANVRFLRARADQIDELFAGNLAAIWLTFSDPFTRAKHVPSHAVWRKRRPTYLFSTLSVLSHGGLAYPCTKFVLVNASPEARPRRGNRGAGASRPLRPRPAVRRRRAGVPMCRRCDDRGPGGGGRRYSRGRPIDRPPASRGRASP